MDGDPRVPSTARSGSWTRSIRTPKKVCRDCPELLPQIASIGAVSSPLATPSPGCCCSRQLDARPGSRHPVAEATASADLPKIPGHEIHELLGRGGDGRGLQGPAPAPQPLRRPQNAAERRSPAPEVSGQPLSGSGSGGRLAAPEYRPGPRHGRHRRPTVLHHGIRRGRRQPGHEGLAGNPLPPRQAATLLGTLSEAVQAAHRSGIVHRDLKPSSVLLTADGTPKRSATSGWPDGWKASPRPHLDRNRRWGRRATWPRTGRNTGRSRGAQPSTFIPSEPILYELLTGRPRSGRGRRRKPSGR